MTSSKPLPVPACSFEELPDTLVIGEVATLCSTTNAGVAYWINQRFLPARQAGRVWLIEKRALLSYAKRYGIVFSYSKSKRPF